MAKVLALPPATFKTNGSRQRARRRAQQQTPIEVETKCFGSYGVAVEATGTAAQLIAAGVCAAEHLPPGRTRRADGRFETGLFDWWDVVRLTGGSIRVIAHRRADTEAERSAGYTFHRSHKVLQEAESVDAAVALRQALICAIRPSSLHEIRERAEDTGARLEARAAARLTAIFSDIDALLARAEMLVKSATVEVDASERAAYLQSLRDAATLPMPSLPSARPQSLQLVVSAAA